MTPLPCPGLVCFDIDGTLIDGFEEGAPYIWRVLHDFHRSPKDRLDLQRKRFFAGEISYPEWFEHDLYWLKAARATRETILGALGTLRPIVGAAETIRTLQAQGWKTAVLSGSIDVVLDAYFPEIRFDDVRLNRLSFDEHGRLLGGVPTRWDLGWKADGLREMAHALGIPMERTVFVGDGHNDVQVAKVAGTSIAFNCHDPELASVASHVFWPPAPDLRVILGCSPLCATSRRDG